MKIAHALIGLFIASTSTLTPITASSENITVTTSAGNNQPIKLVSGGQFDYFAPPIRARLLNKDLLQSWKSVPVKMLRYPGGTWCDHYLWNNPSAGHFAVGDAKSIVTPEQFIATCRAIDAEPIFQVNVMSVDHTANRINPNDINSIKKGAQRAARMG